MRDRNSVTVSGGRCKKRRRWCRELKWGSISSGRDGVAGSNRALRRVERNARNPGFQRLDDSRCRLVLVTDFGERANSVGRLIAGNPIYAFDFTNCLAKNIVFANNDAVLLRINRENVERLAGGEAQALALADCKIVHAIMTANYVTVFVDDFAVFILQRDFA